MGKRIWMALLTTGMVLPAAAFAEETRSSELTEEIFPIATFTSEYLFPAPAFGSRWQPLHPISMTDHPDNWTRPIADLEFRENASLERFSKLRSLSLLTLAEFGPSRLFLGVNDKGFVGLHFNVLPRYDHERYLEVVRMPYLREDVPDSDDEGLRPSTE